MNEKQTLKKKIQHIELQIKKISQSGSENEVCSSLCNSLILEKAVLKKQLESLNKNIIFEKIKGLIPRKEKLICDYFHNT